MCYSVTQNKGGEINVHHTILDVVVWHRLGFVLMRPNGCEHEFHGEVGDIGPQWHGYWVNVSKRPICRLVFEDEEEEEVTKALFQRVRHNKRDY
jgi:hypothetical protein